MEGYFLTKEEMFKPSMSYNSSLLLSFPLTLWIRKTCPFINRIHNVGKIYRTYVSFYSFVGMWEWRCRTYNFIKTTYDISLNSHISL